jgi:hypothetical protein
VKKFIPVLALVLLAGCAEYKEYTYKDFSVSREQAYDTMLSILHNEGYEVVDIEENYVNELPEIEMKTDWNLRQVGSPYQGNDKRRKAYIKITTVYSERKPFEYQPLNEEQGKEIRKKEGENKAKTEAEKKAELEQTRIGIAVRLERHSDISRPLEADWYYDGPDNFEAAALMGAFEAAWGKEKAGGSITPSPKGEAIRKDELRRKSDKE